MISTSPSRIIRQQTVSIPNLPEGNLQYLLFCTSDPFLHRDIYSLIVVKADEPGSAESTLLYDVAGSRAEAVALTELFVREAVTPFCAREVFAEVAGTLTPQTERRAQKAQKVPKPQKAPKAQKQSKAQRAPQEHGFPRLACLRPSRHTYTVPHEEADPCEGGIFPLRLPKRPFFPAKADIGGQ